MTRTQIQLPNPLFKRLKQIAALRDWSLAELIRRGMEQYAQTCPEVTQPPASWEMPVLRGSGGYRADPATISPEVEAIEQRNKRR